MISIAIIFQMGWHSGLGGTRSLIKYKDTTGIYKLLDDGYPIICVKDISKLVDILDLKTDLDKMMFYTKYKQNFEFPKNIILSNMGLPPVLSLKLLTYCKVAQLYGDINTLVDNKMLPPIYW